MQEKELRFALICYGGVSLAVYMHGITKEIWKLARASRAFHDDSDHAATNDIYRELLIAIEEEAELRLRVFVDIVAGASAGGINGIFLSHAITSGASLEPLTDLWLKTADVEVLTDPDARPFSRFSKFWALPIAWWMAGRRGGTVERTVEVPVRDEVKAKLANFVRARWFQTPFGGETFTGLLLDAFDAMASAPPEAPLLPPGQPLDLFVTVTDFHGHPERLSLHSPEEVVETEHRLILSFSDRRTEPRTLGDPIDLVFAARATASFPGAFPPFTVAELDKILSKRKRHWPGRDAFLARALPNQSAVGSVEKTVLIDGSVLANAPFRPAIEALRDRPAKRQIDRRFIYIDPAPNHRAVRFGGQERELPGFFQTIFGALSDIPREQPIRDNLEQIEARSAHILRMRRTVDAIRPEVESAIEAAFGRTLFLSRPTAPRLRVWRVRAHELSAKNAGYAYASYGHLKLTRIVEDITVLLCELGHGGDRQSLASIRKAIWRAVDRSGASTAGALSGSRASEAVVTFFRSHDLAFRIRRLRTVIRQAEEMGEVGECPREKVEAIREAIFSTLARYLDREMPSFYGPGMIAAAKSAADDPDRALTALAEARDLRGIDDLGDEMLAAAIANLPRAERRTMLLTYLGFAFYDVATLPFLDADEQEEFNPVNVDRIAPDDALAIRLGGAQATLKGIQFNNFGAFFSRAYRENDYLWGRLHGADRLVDIVASALPRSKTMSPGRIADLKRRLFRSILREERRRLKHIPELFETLEREVG